MSEQDLLNLLNLGGDATIADTPADGFDVAAFMGQFQQADAEAW